MSSYKVELKKRRNSLPLSSLRAQTMKKVNFHHYIEGQVASALGLNDSPLSGTRNPLSAYKSGYPRLSAAIGGYPQLRAPISAKYTAAPLLQKQYPDGTVEMGPKIAP
jgi:hypothetical protein